MSGAVAAMLGSELASGAGALDLQTVNSGSYDNTVGIHYYYYHGYQVGVMGSIADGTSDLYSGAAVEQLYIELDANTVTGDVTSIVTLRIDGLQVNSGWTTMEIDGVPLLRTDAVYSQSGGNTLWQWVLGEDDLFSATTLVEFS